MTEAGGKLPGRCNIPIEATDLRLPCNFRSPIKQCPFKGKVEEMLGRSKYL